MRNNDGLEKPIIFIGSGRSGTTIVSEIILRHPDLAFPSNYQRFYKYPTINLIRSLFDNRFWRILGQKKQLNRVNILNRYSFRPTESYAMWNYITGKDVDFSRDFLFNKRAAPKRISFIRNYFSKMVRLQNRKRLAFKITGPSRIAYLMSIFPDACFVNIRRAAIPTLNSFLKVEFWKKRGARKLWWQGPYSKEELEWVEQNKGDIALLTAFQLNKIDEITTKEKQLLNPNYLEISYEDFIANPQYILKEILDFLNLQLRSEACYTYVKDLEIHNRNKPDDAYFSAEKLSSLYKIFKVK